MRKVGLPHDDVDLGDMDSGSPPMMDLESSVSNVVNALSSEEKNKILSEVNNKEIVSLAVLLTVDSYFLQEEYNKVEKGKLPNTLITNFVHNFLSLRISRERKGRKEVINLVAPHVAERETSQVSLWSAVRQRLGI